MKEGNPASETPCNLNIPKTVDSTRHNYFVILKSDIRLGLLVQLQPFLILGIDTAAAFTLRRLYPH
jgi:hypothetical protein